MPDMMFQALDPTGLNETAEQVRAIVQAAKADIEEELGSLDYAQPDGIYPDMTVGAVIGADETAQWSTRESTGTGSATVRSVQGAAVAWNQLIRQPNTSDTVLNYAVTRVRKTDDGTVTLNGTAAGTGSAQYILIAGLISITSGHKYYLTKHNDALNFYINVNGSNNHMTNVASIFTAGEDRANAEMYMVVPNDGYTFNNFVCVPQLFDLTQMFGSGNEPTTITEFERMYPAAYYPYSAPTLKPVQIAGIQSTDAQGGELDSVEWETQTLRAAGSVRDELTAGELVKRVGVVDLGTLAWEYNSTYAFFRASVTPTRLADSALVCDKYQYGGLTYDSPMATAATGIYSPRGSRYIYVKDTTYNDEATFKTAMNGVTCFYVLETPTTTPISPALPMTYRVQQGGAESIIVPEGEISAAPILTVASPVNMSTELARIWAAIEALQANRGSALGSVRNDSDVSSTEVKEAPTMDEKQTTERESEI